LNEDVHKAYDDVIEELMHENHSLRVKKRYWQAIAVTTIVSVVGSVILFTIIY
jgi:fructose-1,6-bisphosphatase